MNTRRSKIRIKTSKYEYETKSNSKHSLSPSGLTSFLSVSSLEPSSPFWSQCSSASQISPTNAQLFQEKKYKKNIWFLTFSYPSSLNAMLQSWKKIFIFPASCNAQNTHHFPFSQLWFFQLCNFYLFSTLPGFRHDDLELEYLPEITSRGLSLATRWSIRMMSIIKIWMEIMTKISASGLEKQ